MEESLFNDQQLKDLVVVTKEDDFVSDQLQKLAEKKKAKLKRDRKRWYLHGVVKKQGYTIDVYQRTLYIPITQEEHTKQALRLRDEFGYAFQTQII